MSEARTEDELRGSGPAAKLGPLVEVLGKQYLIPPGQGDTRSVIPTKSLNKKKLELLNLYFLRNSFSLFLFSLFLSNPLITHFMFDLCIHSILSMRLIVGNFNSAIVEGKS